MEVWDAALKGAAWRHDTDANRVWLRANGWRQERDRLTERIEMADDPFERARMESEIGRLVTLLHLADLVETAGDDGRRVADLVAEIDRLDAETADVAAADRSRAATFPPRAETLIALADADAEAARHPTLGAPGGTRSASEVPPAPAPPIHGPLPGRSPGLVAPPMPPAPPVPSPTEAIDPSLDARPVSAADASGSANIDPSVISHDPLIVTADYLEAYRAREIGLAEALASARGAALLTGLLAAAGATVPRFRDLVGEDAMNATFAAWLGEAGPGRERDLRAALRMIADRLGVATPYRSRGLEPLVAADELPSLLDAIASVIVGVIARTAIEADRDEDELDADLIRSLRTGDVTAAWVAA